MTMEEHKDLEEVLAEAETRKERVGWAFVPEPFVSDLEEASALPLEDFSRTLFFRLIRVMSPCKAYEYVTMSYEDPFLENEPRTAFYVRMYLQRDVNQKNEGIDCKVLDLVEFKRKKQKAA